MSEKYFDNFLDFGSSKIRLVAFNKNNKNTNHLIETNCLSDININKLNFLNFKDLIDKLILETEKKTGEYLDNINLMLDTPDVLSVGLSLSKKMEGNKIKKQDIEYLIQDAKQQVIRSYPDEDIIHIIVTNYIINDINYNSLPSEVNCNKVSIDIIFICFPKKLIKSLEELFYKHHVSIQQILFSSYAKSLNYKDELGSFQNIAFIDIGYEKTSVMYFKNDNFNFFHMIAIGSHHITKDISKILNIDLEKSENAKLNFDKDNNFLKENNLSLDLIKKIIFARVEEILEISTQYFKLNKLHKDSSELKLILMGEGSRILDNKFKENISFSRDIDLLEETSLDICESGLKLQQGINKQEVVIVPKKLKKKGFFERLFHLFR